MCGYLVMVTDLVGLLLTVLAGRLHLRLPSPACGRLRSRPHPKPSTLMCFRKQQISYMHLSSVRLVRCGHSPVTVHAYTSLLSSSTVLPDQRSCQRCSTQLLATAALLLRLHVVCEMGDPAALANL